MSRRILWLCVLSAASLPACGDSDGGRHGSPSTAAGNPGAAGDLDAAGTGAAATGAGSSAAGAFGTAGAGAGSGGAARLGGSGGSSAGSGASAGMRGPISQAGRGSRGPSGTSGGGGAAAGGASASGAGGSAAAGGSAGGNGGTRSAGAGGSADCPTQGAITYELARDASPNANERAAYDKITEAMDRALEIYNCYTNFTWKIRVSYVPSVQTADGNVNGAIRFGSMDSMNYITAMHETSHTLGVGGPKYQTLVRDGIFTGRQATQELRTLTGDPAAELHGDNQHFWPYGLNYTSEVKGMEDLFRHCAIVSAMRKDLGL